MYKNPIFGDIIPQKNHQFILQYNIFPKFVKILQICKHFPHNIFPKKITPSFLFHLPVATVLWKITGR